eukprot:TRINITY_DN5278_c0_g1_i2.p1 TRINITY_DN5278_c0_g1~~TRINITY_DN5278_c0_g1_i2.p1  ORF type:complete len:430 (-),score=120.53 TRINITY_DN5278_c0_g1_i2:114-1346(-)
MSDQQTRESEALVAWANSVLKARHLEAHILADFSDGVLLVNLLEIAFNAKLGRYEQQPQQVFQKLNNVYIAFEFMQRNGMPLLSIDCNDIVQQKPKQTLNVLSSILRASALHGLRSMLSASSDSGSASSASASNSSSAVRDTLLSWCRSNFPDSIEIKDFGASFQNGKAFCALVNRFVPNQINMEAVMQEESTSNLDLAFRIAEQHLGIPSLLTSADFASVSSLPDEATVMNYVCMLVSAGQSLDKKHRELQQVLEESDLKSQQQSQEHQTQLSELQNQLQSLQQALEDSQRREVETRQQLHTCEEQADQDRNMAARRERELVKQLATVNNELIDTKNSYEHQLQNAQEEITRLTEELAQSKQEYHDVVASFLLFLHLFLFHVHHYFLRLFPLFHHHSLHYLFLFLCLFH